MAGADHPHCGGTLDHLDLLAQLETDCLPLVDVEVDGVLASPVLTAPPSTLTHRHRHPGWLTRLPSRLAGLVAVVTAGVGRPSLVGVASMVRVVGLLPVLQTWREGAHVVCLSAVAGVGCLVTGPVTSVAPVT